MSQPIPLPVAVGTDVINNGVPVNLDNPSPSLPVIPPRKSPNKSTSTNINLHSVTQLSQPTNILQDDMEENDDFVLVHHEEQAHYVLGSYCLPTNISTDPKIENKCRFDRNCIIHRCKVFKRGELEPELSPTAYCRSANVKKSKFFYNILDTCLIKCFAPNCKKKNTIIPKVFHHVCYMHFLLSKGNEDLTFIELNRNDNIMKEYISQLIMRDINIPKGCLMILPACGRQCHKNVIKLIEKLQEQKNVTTNKDGTTKTTWDKDGSELKRCSIQVLVDWLSTEENATAYFGGKLKRGQTNSARKETYHYKIKNLIFKENGSVQTAESVKSKINRLIQQYHVAEDRFMGTGQGLEREDHPSFHSMVISNHCRWYNELSHVFKDRPNVRPIYTNKSDENNLSSDSSDSQESLNSSQENDESNTEVRTQLVEVETSSSDSSGNSRNTKEKPATVTVSTTTNTPSTIQTIDMTDSNEACVNTSTTAVLDTSTVSTLTSEFDTVTNTTTSTQLINHCRDISQKVNKQRGPSKKKAKLTPSEAKELQ